MPIGNRRREDVGDRAAELEGAGGRRAIAQLSQAHEGIAKGPLVDVTAAAVALLEGEQEKVEVTDDFVARDLRARASEEAAGDQQVVMDRFCAVTEAVGTGGQDAAADAHDEESPTMTFAWRTALNGHDSTPRHAVTWSPSADTMTTVVLARFTP